VEGVLELLPKMKKPGVVLENLLEIAREIARSERLGGSQLTKGLVQVQPELNARYEQE
jgi:hypothetical protein